MSYIQKPGSGARKDVTLIPGTYIGPEVVESVIDIFKAANCPVDFKVIDKFDFTNSSHREKLRQNKAILLGNLGRSTLNPLEEFQNETSAARTVYLDRSPFYKYLDLYVKVTHCHSIPNVQTNYKNIDFVIMRAGLEGEYSNIEHEVYPGVFESIKVVTLKEATRVAKYAFEHAYQTGRKRVSAIHKANIMKLCDGQFLEGCREVAKDYPHIEYDEIIVDNTSMQLIKNPHQFDVMVMPNLYGSIINGIAAGLVGGPGIIAGANFGPEYMVFEQGTRSSAADIAGKGIANPSAMIMSSINMLRCIGFPRFGDLINEGLLDVYREGKIIPQDVGGTASTKIFTKRVIEQIKKLDQAGY